MLDGRPDITTNISLDLGHGWESMQGCAVLQ
jgi:hypothetical protein